MSREPSSEDPSVIRVSGAQAAVFAVSSVVTLRECPFCDGPGRVKNDARNSPMKARWYATCRGPVECGAEMGFYESEVEAAAAWNRRAVPGSDQWRPMPCPNADDALYIVVNSAGYMGVATHVCPETGRAVYETAEGEYDVCDDVIQWMLAPTQPPATAENAAVLTPETQITR